MKTLFNILLALCVTGSVFANGINPSEVRVMASGTDALIVMMDAPLKTAVEITIVDLKGTVLHRENMQAGETVAKQFNLRDLPQGNYKLAITDLLVETTYSFKITPRALLTNTAPVEQSYKPYVFVEGGEAVVSYINLDKKKVMVRLYDANNTVVYEDTIKGNGRLDRRYDFNQLPSSDYTLVVSAGRHSVTSKLAR